MYSLARIGHLHTYASALKGGVKFLSRVTKLRNKGLNHHPSINESIYAGKHGLKKSVNDIAVNESHPGMNLQHTNIEAIDSNNGLKQFVTRTYLWTGGAICGSIGLGIVGSNSLALSNVPMLMLSSALLSLGGVYGISKFKHTIHQGLVNHKLVSYSKNSPARLLSYGAVVTGMGFSMVPMCVIFPDTIFPAFVAASSVFGGASAYALTRKTGELEKYKGVLYGGLSGLFGVSVLGLCSDLIFGHNWFGNTTDMLSLYGGIPLFTGLIAYDTHKAIEMYLSGNPDHLGCASMIYVDFINLFVRLVRIIGTSRHNRSR